MDEKIKELTLLLLSSFAGRRILCVNQHYALAQGGWLRYLTSWEEKVIPGVKVNRSWKGYPFEILDELTEAGLIYGTKKAKSVRLSEDGMKAGK